MRKLFAHNLRRSNGLKWGLCAILTLLACACTISRAGSRWGEFGGSLDFLRSCITPPQTPGESNFYIDMVDGSFRRFASAHGLTNNHALFVVSHGKVLDMDFGPRYAFHPEKSSPKVPCYSAADLARIIGSTQARQIHILVLAGCNQDNMLSPKELKRYFPNATNIIHALPGTDANLASFWEMLTYPSHELFALHPPRADLASRHFGATGSSKHRFYMAELYQPGARKPYRKQVAGRELFQPAPSPASSLAFHPNQ